MVKAKDIVLEKAGEIEQRYTQIETELSDVATAKDSAKVIALSKEQGRLRGMVEKYRRYKKTEEEIADAEDILKDAGIDEEFRGLAKAELTELEDRRDNLLEEMENSLVTADDMRVGSVIMEIRAGTGGEEAALFARDLYQMYTRYADRRKWKVEQMSFSTTERGGFREVIFSIKGEGVWSELGYEGGGHRVQRVPVTESQGRIHTSAATVAVLPEPEEVDIVIKESDVIEQVFRSSGPGGQNVNKISSAIRLEHIPTGITVNMQDEQSQHKNRAKAWRILRSRLYEMEREKRRAERDQKRKTMIGSGDRSEKIRTYNFPQNRVTDHRTNLSLYTLDKIIDGDMKELIAALKDYDREQRLKNL
jgi:peptide chain release factor 1